MNRTITTKEFEMPVSALIEVADILIENELHHNIIATDEENESVTIEIEYEKEDRDAIHQIQDIISVIPFTNVFTCLVSILLNWFR